MAITVQISREGVEGSANNIGEMISESVRYWVFGTNNQDEACAALVQEVPPTLNNLTLTGVDIDKHTRGIGFKFVCNYTKIDLSSGEAAPEPVYSFSTKGGTRHITQSIKHMAAFPEKAKARGGLLGFDGEAVRGIDIPAGTFTFSETHYLPPEVANLKYRSRLGRLSGESINKNSFRGFDPYEVLFIGADGRRQGTTGFWEISFEFAVSQTRKNFTVGSLNVTQKAGWDRMEVYYKDKVDDDLGVVLKVPEGVCIERVYNVVDFSLLGIGKADGETTE